MESLLQSLRDIEGVLGSFLLDSDGRLLARDMPSMFDDSTLTHASLRLSQLRAALEAGAEAFEGCTARFGGHLLLLRAAQARTLCVLCPVGTNLNTLTMGLNLVARRMAAPARAAWPGVAQAPSTPPAHGAAAPAARVSAPPAPPEERPELVPQDPNSTTRIFRGRPVP